MPEPLYDEGFSYRLRQAVKAFELARGRDVTQEELGAIVGKALKRDPFTGVAVHRWLKGRRPGYEVMIALAGSLGVRPGWLAFGETDEVAKLSVARAAESKAALKPGGRTQRSKSPGRRRSDRAG